MDKQPARAWVGRRPLARLPDYTQYAEMTSSIGIKLSVHDAYQKPGQWWVTTTNHRGDHMPIRLDLDQVRALHEACGLILADHDATISGSTEPLART